MTTISEPTYGREIISPLIAAKAKYDTGDWVVPSGTTKLSKEAALHTQITAGPYDGFAYNSSVSSGLTARIGTGEAFVGGRLLASDDQSMTDTVTDTLVHEVTLPANDTTSVYLGPDDRTNNAATDRIIIGRDDAGQSDFPSDTTPKTELYQFTTDADSITAVSNERQTTQPIAAHATSADNADSLGGTAASNWARTDNIEQFTHPIGIGTNFALPIDTGEAERLRLSGDFSDSVIQTTSGAARTSLSYNADAVGGVFNIINSDDNASVIGMNSANPGVNFGAIITLGGYQTSTGTSDGDQIDWEWIGFDRGHVWTNGDSMIPIPTRGDTPSPTAVPYSSAGMWVDPGANTVNFVLDDGRTASLNLDTTF